MLAKLLLVAAGGALGSVLRYLVSGSGQALAESLRVAPFPLGTLLVNLLGSAAIGAFMALVVGPQPVAPEWRLLLIVGVLGGFTTFSAFAYETISLLNDAQVARAVANVLLNNVLSLAAAWFAFRAVRGVYGV